MRYKHLFIVCFVAGLLLQPTLVLADAPLPDTIIGNSTVRLTLESRLAGAVGSLVYRGKEYLYSLGHGAALQYAVQGNGHVECYNPTEAGSRADWNGPFSTSVWNSLKLTASASATTRTQMAFWLTPGETSDYNSCQAVNTTRLSEYQLTKKVTVGFLQQDNVIEFDANVHVPEDLASLSIEAPAGYLQPEFSTRWVFNPRDQVLTPATHEGAYMLPIIFSTSDSQAAMGVYTPETLTGKVASYGMFWSAQHIYPAAAAVKWDVLFQRGATPAGNYAFKTYVVVGTLEEVKQGLVTLDQYFQAPYGFGYVDQADNTTCSLTGWAVDALHPSQNTTVKVYRDGTNLTGTLVAQVSATVARPDVNDYFTLTGDHGYNIDLSRRADVNDGRSHVFNVYTASASVPENLTLLTFSPAWMVCAPGVGDINHDLKVDIFDYNLLVGDYGQTDSPADLNHSGRVDIFDYNLLIQHFGT